MEIMNPKLSVVTTRRIMNFLFLGYRLISAASHLEQNVTFYLRVKKALTISHIVSALTIFAQPTHNAIQHQLLTLVNVKMVISEVDFHVYQQTVQPEPFNLVKPVSVISVPTVNHDSHAVTKMQAHHQQHANAKKDGLETENSVCQRKM